jgi:hypothetical protein
MRRFPTLSGLLLLLVLTACGGPARQGDVGQPAALECVPFARALSGINIHGDAAEWWWRASGQYYEGRVPQVGAVLVFAQSPTLPRGHVSVVSQVLSQREILVTQANWVHHHVTTDQLVVDISPYGDWSLVRAWWPPANTLGNTRYPILGFIYSGYPASHDQIVRAVPEAMHLAQNQ